MNHNNTHKNDSITKREKILIRGINLLIRSLSCNQSGIIDYYLKIIIKHSNLPEEVWICQE